MLIQNINTPQFNPSNKKARKMKVDESSRRTRDNVQWDRRRQSERRRDHSPLSSTERRHRNDRRQPELLNALTAKPEKVSSQKGQTINTSA